MNNPLSAAVALAAVALLAGCTATAEPTDAASPDPAGSAASSPAPTSAETAEPEAWTAPADCLSLELTPGTALAGPALGACVSTALASFGSGKEFVESDQVTGEVVFRYDPEFEMQGDVQGSDGPMSLTYIDSTMWIDRGDGPIKGDLASSDFDEQMVGVAGELYRVFSDPTMVAELIAAGAEWNVATEEPIALGNGEAVQAYRIEVLGDYVWNEIPISSYVVWFEEDWTPVGAEGTVVVANQTGTARQTFYDLGEPVEIVPVG